MWKTNPNGVPAAESEGAWLDVLIMLSAGYRVDYCEESPHPRQGGCSGALFELKLDLQNLRPGQLQLSFFHLHSAA